MTEADPLIGTLIAERYRVVRRLGAGGMGTVYVASQEPLGRMVALKVVRRELATDARAIERFRREAISLAAAQHPHIVTLLDFGELPSRELYVAMELMQGETLRRRFQLTGALAPPAVMALIQSAAAALSCAHALGIIHRDLKPENIFLMEAAGSEDFVKLLDFGVAKLTDAFMSDDEDTPAMRPNQAFSDESLTARGSVMGTPGYIAPEMSLRGVTDDPRSDLYALGVVAFEALAGAAPFRAPTPTALLMAHALEPVPALPDAVPAPLAALVRSLLAKNPADRPASADALVRLVDQLTGRTSGLAAAGDARPSADPYAVTMQSPGAVMAVAAAAAPGAPQPGAPQTAATLLPAAPRRPLWPALAAAVGVVVVGAAILIALTQPAATDASADPRAPAADAGAAPVPPAPVSPATGPRAPAEGPDAGAAVLSVDAGTDAGPAAHPSHPRPRRQHVPDLR